MGCLKKRTTLLLKESQNMGGIKALFRTIMGRSGIFSSLAQQRLVKVGMPSWRETCLSETSHDEGTPHCTWRFLGGWVPEGNTNEAWTEPFSSSSQSPLTSCQSKVNTEERASRHPAFPTQQLPAGERGGSQSSLSGKATLFFDFIKSHYLSLTSKLRNAVSYL